MERIVVIRLSDEEKQIVGSFMDIADEIAVSAGIPLTKVFNYLCTRSKLIDHNDKRVHTFDELIPLDAVRNHDTPASLKGGRS